MKEGGREGRGWREGESEEEGGRRREKEGEGGRKGGKEGGGIPCSMLHLRLILSPPVMSIVEPQYTCYM